jgi:hypothetical protein
VSGVTIGQLGGSQASGEPRLRLLPTGLVEAVIRAARHRQRRRRLSIGVLILVGAASVSIYFALGRTPSTPATQSHGATLTTVTRFALHGGPVGLVNADGGLWVVLETSAMRAELIKLDPSTGSRSASYLIGRTGPDFGAATAAGGVIYATAGNHIIRVDQHRTTKGIERPSLPGEGAAISVGYGSVWVASIGQAHNTITRFDARTLARQAQIPLTIQPVALQAGLGSMWLASTSGLWRIDAATNRVRPLAIPLQYPVGLALSGNRMWLIQQTTLIDGIDRNGQIRKRIALPFDPGEIAASPGHLWVTNNCGCMDGVVALIDSRTGRIISERRVGETPVAVTTDERGAWVATFGDGSVSHLVPTAR